MSQTVRTRPEGSARPLSAAYDTALLDLDGVVYAGGNAIAHAVASLDTARAGGMHLAYVTNNALRTPDAVAGHLTELGIPTKAPDVITSAQAVARLIGEQLPAGSRVLVVGGEGLRVALRERGLEPVESADDDPAAVVQGYGGPDLPWGRFAEACYAIARGLPWFASNTDLTIPSARGIAPGNGAAVEVVRIATGAEPQVAGKPLPPMHRETILRTGAERPLVVGDRLDTDIEGAFNGGVDSLLVLTGVTDGAQLLAAPPAAPADVCGRGSARAADRAAGGPRGGRRVPLRGLDGGGRLIRRGGGVGESPAGGRGGDPGRAAGAVRGGVDGGGRGCVPAGRREGAGPAGAVRVKAAARRGGWRG